MFTGKKQNFIRFIFLKSVSPANLLQNTKWRTDIFRYAIPKNENRKHRNMKHFFLVVLLGTLYFLSYAQNSTLSGYIRDAESGEALTGATCYVPEIQKGVTSNAYGFYSVTLPQGSHQISFSFIGYETQIVEINLEENQILDVFMKEKTTQLGDVVVMAERRDQNITGTEMSMERVSIKFKYFAHLLELRLQSGCAGQYRRSVRLEFACA